MINSEVTPPNIREFNNVPEATADLSTPVAAATYAQDEMFLEFGMGESPRGVSPRGARRTVRDTLASYGSHQGTTAHSGPVREQMRSAAGYRPNPAPCTLDTIAQLLVFLSGPFDQFLIQLADH
jgi:hypothetical protein